MNAECAGGDAEAGVLGVGNAGGIWVVFPGEVKETVEGDAGGVAGGGAGGERRVGGRSAGGLTSSGRVVGMIFVVGSMRP